MLHFMVMLFKIYNLSSLNISNNFLSDNIFIGQ